VWACRKCNAHTNHDDDYFRNVLVTMFDQQHPVKSALFNGKVIRSLAKRPDWLRHMLADVRTTGLFGPSGLWIKNLPTLTVDCDRLARSLRKIIKGLYYLIKNRPFPSAGEIAIIAEAHEDNWELLCFIEEHLTPVFDFGDDVFEWRFLQTLDGVTGWKLAFYRSTVFYAVAFDEIIDRSRTSEISQLEGVEFLSRVE
jgi:hypothetical protein